MNDLLKVSLRQKAVFIPIGAMQNDGKMFVEDASVLVANLAKLGYGVSEPLLKNLNRIHPDYQKEIWSTFRNVMGVNKNWTPLVKGWDTPTGESYIDHVITFLTNVFQTNGVRLPCGHIIPENTFPLERYNGCPFCGTPFQSGKLRLYGQGSKLKVLDLWSEKDTEDFFISLLGSKTALDATQTDSLRILLDHLPLPSGVNIGMKETLMSVIDLFVAAGEPAKAQPLFTSPADVLRYLWYKHTGFLQVIEPKTIIRRTARNNAHIFRPADQSLAARYKTAAGLKLKYNRAQCLMVASWLNGIDMDVEKMCETMHPKRNMWVRFIRALRLAEYSKRPGFERLHILMDTFYNEMYEVWQGRVNYYRLRADANRTMELLKQRPGLFARSLFANMLWFGWEDTIIAFSEVIDKVPARLVFTLNMYAESYFDKGSQRIVKPLGGIARKIPANRMLEMYNDVELDAMKSAVAGLCEQVTERRFTAIANENCTMYIDPALFGIPVAIGDRSDTVQDMPSALQGTRFEVEGDRVRLFMHWGAGLPAQPLDMDLSCLVAYKNRVEMCSFSSLAITGCKHSGDIRSIPNKIGTAEYIELDLPILQKAGAQYVTFICNAYSCGSITPNMTVGWMNSRFPMKVSERTGVAYDPSCVQHQVRVVNSLSKGLVFGVLRIATREIVWLEMSFGGQVAQNLSLENVELLLKKLESKLSIGQLLRSKAKAQGLQLVDSVGAADEAYTMQWAQNAAAVTQLLVG